MYENKEVSMPQQIHSKTLPFQVTYFSTTNLNAMGVNNNAHGDTMDRFEYDCIFVKSVDEHATLSFE